MKYTGRVSICIITILITIAVIIFRHLTNNYLMADSAIIILTIILLPIVWWLGMQYDQARFLNKELQQSKLEIESLFNKNELFLWSNDLVNNIVTVSKGVEKIHGYSEHEFKEDYNLWQDVIFPEDREIADRYFQELLEGKTSKAEWRFYHKNGELRWNQSYGNPILDDNGYVIKLNGVVYDITDRKELEEKLQYLAYHDTLTGLPNREALKNHFNEAIQKDGKRVAIMFIDLDRFKFINDTLGHSIGDQFLAEVSKRIVEVVPKGNLVSRQGGDEFIVMLDDTDKTKAKEIAKQILQNFTSPFLFNKNEYFTTPSIGISFYPEDGQSIDTLVKKADAAMFIAKRHGRNTYQYYIPEDERLIERKRKVEQGLIKGLMNNEFFLQYQPKVDLTTNNICGVEALIRWRHPELGIISPLEFIPIAEKTGVIVPLGEWVIREACEQNKKWQQSTGKAINIAVNISAIQFQHSLFFKKILDILRESKLSPEFLEIEITESVMQNLSYSAGVIDELKNIGVKVSIDDFGTGYSSLSVLNQLQIDTVKIDKSFIDDILTSPSAAALVKTMIEMGKSLDFDLVAEGIEDVHQAEFLIENGCKYGQGYYYSKPLPANEIEEIINRNFSLTVSTDGRSQT